ncbi:MAG: DNA-directed RNA polymerase subunit beta, partial [Lentisphaeria bacterium]|nr:DNA-directed RNA polymerase subunit beta [Lentisphaeria bacterium]NQZ68442.1 DNA-directed RNA polymerase subunit beta [Lentisphaeria bacterium]
MALERRNYGKLKEVLEIPDLIDVQLKSYNQFLQRYVDPEKREDTGLQEVFKEIFPIESFDKSCEIDYVSYEIGEPKSNKVDCIRTSKSYGVSLHMNLRVENRTKKETKIERVFLGDMPLMTDSGTFIINGAERVIISQLHRSPGICFETDRHTSGRILYSFRVIPDRGSWMDVQFDINDLIFIFLDRRRRRRKFLVSTFLRALGHSTTKELLDVMYGVEKMKVSKLSKMSEEELAQYYLAETIVDEDGDPLEDEKGNDVGRELEQLSSDLVSIAKDELKIKELEVSYVGELDHFINCLQHDPSTNTDEALKEIYRKMRPGDPVSVANAKTLLNRLFQDQKRYDLGVVGRHKINQKLGTTYGPDVRTLQDMDIVHATRHMMNLRAKEGDVDDIDHLGNRRVRSVGELIQNQFRVGLARTERL